MVDQEGGRERERREERGRERERERQRERERGREGGRERVRVRGEGEGGERNLGTFMVNIKAQATSSRWRFFLYATQFRGVSGQDV